MKIHGESDAERLARLEAQMVELQQSHAEEKESIDDIKGNIQTILQELSRYKGFLGGLIFFATCLGAFFKAIPFIGSLLSK